MKVDRTEFAAKFHEGLNRKAMAEHFKVNPTTITVIRKELGLPAFSGTPRLSEVDLSAIEVMLDEGMSFSEIHRSGGPTLVTLRKYFPGRGWELGEGLAFRRLISRSNDSIAKHFGNKAATITVR